MGRIRMDSIHVTDKIHMDHLRDLDPVTIDMFGVIEMEVKPNQHHMVVDLEYFQDRIIDYVERNHPMDLTKIVEGWEVPSYNLIKELGNSNSMKTSSYEVFVDKDGWVERIVIMTERNCKVVLEWLLEMVR
jgi:hypothetical protein